MRWVGLMRGGWTMRSEMLNALCLAVRPSL